MFYSPMLMTGASSIYCVLPFLLLASSFHIPHSLIPQVEDLIDHVSSRSMLADRVGSETINPAAGSSWFLPNLNHENTTVRGYVPNLIDGKGSGNHMYDYPVYIAVKPGDSEGFVNAIASQGPQGMYTLSSTAYILTDTVIIGDAANPPTIKAASSFTGDYLICGGEGGYEGQGELHFSVSIRNMVLDTTANNNQGFIALSWRVAQNSALNNIKITLPKGRHTGIWMGQGSTISVGDVQVQYGAYGLRYSGHQQAQLKNLHFNYCTVGISIDGGSTITIFAPTCNRVGQCIVFNSGAPWVSVIDGSSVNSGDFFTSNVEFPNFMLENISKDTTNSNMVTIKGKVRIGGVKTIGEYTHGNTYGANPVYQATSEPKTAHRSSILAPNGKYPNLAAPQYADKTVNDVINLKDPSQNGGYNLHGDGTNDDTAALQGALNTAASAGKIGYLPFGVYRVTSTLTIPDGSQIYGEAWSMISGYGNVFNDITQPTPVVQIGTPGSRGKVVVQDLCFTVGQALPGAIILQVNMAGLKPGDVAIFNSMITVGGTRDTALDCQSEADCIGAYVGLYLPSDSSAYVENVWVWVADHPSDDSGSGKGISSANKGGILVESQLGTWLMGIGSEHWWLYNLNYHNAQQVLMSFYQSEMNYHQGTKAQVLPPAPFTLTASDPSFSWCNEGDVQCRMTIAQYWSGDNTSDIWHYAAGSWNFKDLVGCDQLNMNVITDQIGNAQLHGFTDHDTTYLFRLPSGKQFGNGGQDGFGGSWGSLAADLATQS